MIPIKDAVLMLANIPPKGRDLQMPGTPDYQPKELKPYLGKDAMAGWLVIVAWFWLYALAKTGVMPSETAKLLTPDLLEKLLRIKMTRVREVERQITQHDILALLRLMRAIMPRELHRWLHLGGTSYDLICTAYALQIYWTFTLVFLPKAQAVSREWQLFIRDYAGTVQLGRTHLQDATPVTVGLWLAVLHSRFIDAVGEAQIRAGQIPGKWSGATGTKAPIRSLSRWLQIPPNIETELLTMLGLPAAPCVTQITPPEPTARFYNELGLMSAALANLGEDMRILQSSKIGEIDTPSSSSSAMSHKTGNPIAAEQLAGMYVSVLGEQSKVLNNLISDLQRDLRNSNVMRGYAAIFVFAYQQLLTTERIFKKLVVRGVRILDNCEAGGKFVVAELLHLSLQVGGVPDAHHLVNTKIVPQAKASGKNLAEAMDAYARRSRSEVLRRAWAAVPSDVWDVIANPYHYIGDAVAIAKKEGAQLRLI